MEKKNYKLYRAHSSIVKIEYFSVALCSRAFECSVTCRCRMNSRLIAQIRQSSGINRERDSAENLITFISLVTFTFVLADYENLCRVCEYIKYDD